MRKKIKEAANKVWEVCQANKFQWGTDDIVRSAISKLREVLDDTEKFPKVVCLCGSTKFTEQMLILQWELTKLGVIVLSWCALPDSYFENRLLKPTTHIGDAEGVKELVDEVHKRKIDLADEVFVLNVGRYIGESTRSEIDYAIKTGKPVGYLEKIERGE